MRREFDKNKNQQIFIRMCVLFTNEICKSIEIFPANHFCVSIYVNGLFPAVFPGCYLVKLLYLVHSGIYAQNNITLFILNSRIWSNLAGLRLIWNRF